ncbi:MAG: mechanosensitive ion channel family protein [Verrucomicrobiae bacterium]|nr:mechanosensitive ion channel family protein [Verrucomicrobiae bacterium]
MNEELDQLQNIVDLVIQFFVNYSFQIIGGVIILIVGFVVGGMLSRLVTKICQKRNIDLTLERFFSGVTRLIIVLLFLIIALKKLGIDIAPFVALMGAGALGLSLAVQGPISNYGAGIVLIITRPFNVNDTLTVLDERGPVTGLVQCIHLGFTELMAEDGEMITIPNRRILGEILTNSYKFRVVEGVVGIEYASSPEKAIEAIENALKETEGVDKDHSPEVGIEEFGDSSINIGYRFWVPTADYHKTMYRGNLAVFKALKAVGINIPFPQRDVRIYKNSDGI